VEKLASTFVSMNISRGNIVALVLHRCTAQVVAVYGVLAAGAAFLPIGDEVPFLRQRDLIAESQAAAVVAMAGEASDSLSKDSHVPIVLVRPDGGIAHISSSPNPRDTHNVADIPNDINRPSDLAMLIYTSGTSGAPKGIMYDHRHLNHGVYFFGDQCEMTKDTTALLKSPYFWAVIEWEMFPVLTRGGKLVIAQPDGHKNPEYLVHAVQQEQVSVLMLTASVLGVVLDLNESQGAAAPFQCVRHLANVGEALPTELANRTLLQLPWLKLHNFYGASESSCAVYTLPSTGVPVESYPKNAPAGRPQPHTKVYVMKVCEGQDQPDLLEPVSGGEAGEICFGGVLAAGYYQLDALTKEKWVETRYGTLYRTGDLGRWYCGNLEVLGRKDRQVKVRGVRVEPEEVEAVLKQFTYPSGQPPHAGSPPASGLLQPATSSACLQQVAVVPSAEPVELVAFVSFSKSVSKDFACTEAHLREHCAQRLAPAYVPKFFIIVPGEFPQLPNGKADLRALKQMATDHVEAEGEEVSDSLGQMKKMTRGALAQTQVIHRCYTFWMFGVLLDHYCSCSLEGMTYCLQLGFTHVHPWTELLVRSLGNYQDMFGFLILGAYQDSQNYKNKKIRFRQADVLLITLYLMMWGQGTRWYILVMLQARLVLVIGSILHIPALLQILSMLVVWLLPHRLYPAVDMCSPSWNLPPLLNAFFMALLAQGREQRCQIMEHKSTLYILIYVAAFHMGATILAKVSPMLPSKPVHGAIAGATSMTIGMLIGMFDYPLSFGDKKEHVVTWWTVLELLPNTLQPLLFVYAMTFVPLNMTFWGNTTLAVYVFHALLVLCIWPVIIRFPFYMQWDSTGLLNVCIILLLCFLAQTLVGAGGSLIVKALQQAISRVVRAVT